jgi:hypothetical protein
MHLINHAIINEAFLCLTASLPQELEEYHKAYLQGLSDYRRQLIAALSETGGYNDPP